MQREYAQRRHKEKGKQSFEHLSEPCVKTLLPLRLKKSHQMLNHKALKGNIRKGNTKKKSQNFININELCCFLCG